MTTMKITGFTRPLVVLAMVAAVSFSQTATAVPCENEIDALKIALEGGICPQLKSRKAKSRKAKSRKSSSKQCKGLDHKLDNTARKLEKGKFLHAARKLSDFGSVIEDMAMRRKPKISVADYEALINPYYLAAAECIANGGVTTTPVIDDSAGGQDEPPPPITVQF